MARPDGREGSAVVWTPEQMKDSAPYGVLDTELQARAAALGIETTERLSAPISGPRGSDMVEDTGDHDSADISATATDDED